jgi:hypothetical protein
MPLLTRKWPFLDYVVGSSPTDQGLYALWKEGELLFVGIADDQNGIRGCLVRHFGGEHGPLLQSADHFSWELAFEPEKRRSEVLQAFEKQRGRLPLGHAKS